MKQYSQTIIIQRLEGLARLIIILVVYSGNNLSWTWFAVGLLVPDISMAGYLVNKRLGALVYNLGHTYIFSLPLSAIGYWQGSGIILGIGLIWTAHITLDRALGFGLKETTDFRHTHLGTIGKK